jgi:hypothetical protein
MTRKPMTLGTALSSIASAAVNEVMTAVPQSVTGVTAGIFVSHFLQTSAEAQLWSTLRATILAATKCC